MGRAAQSCWPVLSSGLGEEQVLQPRALPRGGFPAPCVSQGPPESSSEDPGGGGQASPGRATDELLQGRDPGASSAALT